MGRRERATSGASVGCREGEGRCHPLCGGTCRGSDGAHGHEGRNGRVLHLGRCVVSGFGAEFGRLAGMSALARAAPERVLRTGATRFAKVQRPRPGGLISSGPGLRTTNFLRTRAENRCHAIHDRRPEEAPPSLPPPPGRQGLRDPRPSQSAGAAAPVGDSHGSPGATVRVAIGRWRQVAILRDDLKI